MSCCTLCGDFCYLKICTENETSRGNIVVELDLNNTIKKDLKEKLIFEQEMWKAESAKQHDAFPSYKVHTLISQAVSVSFHCERNFPDAINVANSKMYVSSFLEIHTPFQLGSDG